MEVACGYCVGQRKGRENDGVGSMGEGHGNGLLEWAMSPPGQRWRVVPGRLRSTQDPDVELWRVVELFASG